MNRFAIRAAARAAAVVLALGAMLASAGNAWGVGLAPGDVLVVDAGAKVVIKVDPVTGAQTPVSTGGFLVNPQDIVQRGNGEILVSDPGAEGLIGIDPATGIQRIVSPGTFNCWVQVVSDTRALVTRPDGVYNVDLATGVRTPFATGGSFSQPLDIVLSRDGGTAYVLDRGARAVIAVDTATGAQRPFGPLNTLDVCWVVITNDGGRLHVAGPDGVHVFSPDGGELTPLFARAAFGDPTAIAEESTGRFLLADRGLDVIHRLNPATGNISPLTSGGLLSGPTGLWVVTVPEPAGVAMAAASLALLVRRSSRLPARSRRKRGFRAL